MRLYLGLLCLICIMGTAWAQTEFKIITLQHRFAQDLVSALQPLAGPGGVISATGNHLLVEVAPERMAAIEQAVAQLDVASKTFRIRVDRTRSSQESAGSLSARGRLGSGDMRIQRTRPGQSRDGVTIEMDRRSSVSAARGSEYVSVQDGARAFIAVGQSVPVTEYWITAIRNHAQVQSTVRFHEMTTGFTVMPRQIGREVELEIAPRISSLRDDNTIEFFRLATTIRVVPGEWVNIGATMQARDEVSRAILAGEQRQGESNAQIWVLVE